MNEHDFLLAGKITARVREESKKLIKPGAKYGEIADWIVNRIKELKALPAFPPNISANDKAAHDTAAPDDERELKTGDIVKIDLGAQVNGWPGDTAYTMEVDSDKHADLINASREALDAAINFVKKGVKLGEIGKVIQSVINKAGFNPIRNLGGHPLNQNKLHGDFLIPNYDNNSRKELPGGGMAIEPFVTTGDGWVEDTPEILIYSIKRAKPVRDVIARNLLKHIIRNYGTLPFAERWIAREFRHYEYGLRILLKEGVLYGYHVLREASGGLVSQTEHSLLLNSKKIVTTLMS